MSIDSSPFAGRELALRLRPAEERITDLTLRFLVDAERGPLPGVEALDVHPSVLLHPSVPRPDGERMYELLTRHIRRDPGCLVYLCDITDELDLAGTTWYRFSIYPDDVIDALARLAAAGEIPARRLHAPPSPTTEGGTPERPALSVVATRRAAPEGRLRSWLTALHRPRAVPRR